MSNMALDETERDPFNNEAPQPYEEPAAETDLEKRARAMGWAPRSEWKGAPDKWKTAEEFVQFVDGTQHIGVLRENMRRMEQRLEGTNKQLNEATSLIKDQATVITQLKGWADRSEEAGYQRAKSELQERQRQAVLNADPAAHDAATSALDRLEEQHQAVDEPPPAPKPAPQARPAEPPPQEQPQPPTPEMQAWMRENGWWFFADEEMKASAVGLYGGMTAVHPDWGDEPKLKEVLRRIKLMYPEKFKNQRREAPPAVVEPGAPPRPSGGSQPGKFTYDNLSADEKANCDRFVRTIPGGYKREDYVAEYLRQEDIKRQKAGG